MAMTINSIRFGEIEIDEHKIISFPFGLPGLEHAKAYVLLYHDETRPINWLQSVDDTSLSLPVVDPFEIIPSYGFEISDEDIEDLSIEDTADLHVVNVMVIPERVENMTLNLAAPILINIKRNIGKQIVIDGSEYPVRQPVFTEIYNKLREVQPDAGSVKEGE